jgi:hypothetical protein
VPIQLEHGNDDRPTVDSIDPYDRMMEALSNVFCLFGTTPAGFPDQDSKLVLYSTQLLVNSGQMMGVFLDCLLVTLMNERDYLAAVLFSRCCRFGIFERVQSKHALNHI